MPHWRLLVVGDHCDERTEAAVARFDDRRIRYVNLPDWCGDQALPNSIGLNAAGAPVLALLNHDDAWLSDHLEYALAHIERGHELVIMRTIRARHVDPGPPPKPRFSAVSRIDVDLGDGYFASPLFEPASAWVFTRSLWHRVGPWRPARTLLRQPVQDWLMRAWRSGARWMLAPELTVLQVQTYMRTASHLGVGGYSSSSDEYAELRRLLDQPAAQLRSQLLAVTAEMEKPSDARHPARRFARSVYRATGVDLILALRRMRGLAAGENFSSLVNRRVGRPLPPVPDVDRLQRIVDASTADWA